LIQAKAKQHRKQKRRNKIISCLPYVSENFVYLKFWYLCRISRWRNRHA